MNIRRLGREIREELRNLPKSDVVDRSKYSPKVNKTSYHIDQVQRTRKMMITCTICINRLNENISILKCRHSFHANCITKWIRTELANKGNTTCPVCRYEINRKRYPLTLDDLFERNKRECRNCKNSLCDNRLFRIRQNINPLGFFIFCSECSSVEDSADNKTSQEVIGGANEELKALLNDDELEKVVQ